VLLREPVNSGLLRPVATIAQLEQWIADIEIAITVQQARIDAMIRKGDGVRPQMEALGRLRSRLSDFHQRRRQVLNAKRQGA
jgi:hypothetical protein